MSRRSAAALLWGEIFAEAGLPAGVLNIVTHAPGAAGPIGDVLIEQPAVRRLNFTGSTPGRAQLAEAAGRQLKRVVLELGGHNPLIVLDDADLEYAVNASAFGAYLHQGQICMWTRRIYVERSIADEFISRLAEKTKGLKVGDPKEHDTVIGPLINEQALATVKGRVDQAVAAGAKVLAGGEAVGPCYQATVLTDVPGDSEFALHETFGPVAAVEVVDSAEQAVEKANRRATGSSAGIITTDRDRGFSLAQLIDSGIVHVNDQTVADEPQMPFGGVKSSRLRPVRRPGRGGRVHRAAVGDDPERKPPLPVLGMSEALLSDAVRELVRDGDTVALEGFTHLIPHAAGHELMRQGKRELTLVRMTPDVIYDQLIGMGCARKLVFSWGGNPGVGSLHRLRDAVEHDWPGPLALEEHSHAGMAAAYAAGAAHLPFGVLRGYRGRRPSCTDACRDDRLPVHRRGAGSRPGTPAGRRHHPRATRRPTRERPTLGDRRRPEGDGARVGADDRHRRGNRGRARAAARSDRHSVVGHRCGLRRSARRTPFVRA